jgi:hypothetical protein
MIKNKGKKCSVNSCDKPAFCKGYCTKHYQQMTFSGKIKEKIFLGIPGLCKNLNCGQPVFAKGLCQRCYSQQRKLQINA